jgi:hypothetical protein
MSQWAPCRNGGLTAFQKPASCISSSLGLTSSASPPNPKQPLNPSIPNMADAPRSRKKDRNDVPKQIVMSWDLCQKSEARADGLDKSYSRYVRDLIIEDLKKAADEKLSQQRGVNSSSNPIQIPSSPNGLFTAEQVLELFEKLTKK